MSSLSTIQNAAIRKALGNYCNTKIALAINAAAAATVKSTGAIIYAVGGLLITRAALAAQSIAVTHRFDGAPVSVADPAFVQPAGTTVVYVLCANAVGALAVVQGSYVDQPIVFGSDLSKVIPGPGGVPEEPDGFTAIGAIKVVTAAVTFTPGTTALDAAGVTASYFDVAILPATL